MPQKKSRSRRACSSDSRSSAFSIIRQCRSASRRNTGAKPRRSYAARERVGLGITANSAHPVRSAAEARGLAAPSRQPAFSDDERSPASIRVSARSIARGTIEIAIEDAYRQMHRSQPDEDGRPDRGRKSGASMRQGKPWRRSGGGQGRSIFIARRRTFLARDAPSRTERAPAIGRRVVL